MEQELPEPDKGHLHTHSRPSPPCPLLSGENHTAVWLGTDPSVLRSWARAGRGQTVQKRQDGHRCQMGEAGRQAPCPSQSITERPPPPGQGPRPRSRPCVPGSSAEPWSGPRWACRRPRPLGSSEAGSEGAAPLVWSPSGPGSARVCPPSSSQVGDPEGASTRQQDP